MCHLILLRSHLHHWRMSEVSICVFCFLFTIISKNHSQHSCEAITELDTGPPLGTLSELNPFWMSQVRAANNRSEFSANKTGFYSMVREGRRGTHALQEPSPRREVREFQRLGGRQLIRPLGRGCAQSSTLLCTWHKLCPAKCKSPLWGEILACWWRKGNTFRFHLHRCIPVIKSEPVWGSVTFLFITKHVALQVQLESSLPNTSYLWNNHRNK